ncbi:MAG: SRPBCC domain-containing protein [Mycobacterium sp.]|nr:SRPBCC domain-containing protein [Mycobacterium sp.]
MVETQVETNLAEHAISLTRVFDAPRELVWQAWTRPDQFAAWAGCDGFSVPLSTIDMDVRPGGRFRWTMIHDESGEQTPAAGIYVEVVEPTRLVYRWEDGRLAEESIVTITLTELERDRTELTLRQVGWTYGALEWGLHATRTGMAQELDKLARHLKTAAVQAI